ncbi:hypothetical protein I204_03037 [Kwoniella mangroviensis CBS 8886]|uniref:uncharacterized protein n=1 Tax=Kwoniella mangroviensis CBS 8507 TaxID=1296122 RepID=UPI00080D0D42|nr:uncharacterized protein I203_00096 [Kwoniella mangroviensis CBS 8507]OCF69969.1 hypothetical protein I203_00096 [Kwoniella mangroviensis CBS 8507]OCF75745.1 hypothetical protein I204_03037 [Kwoniella mangroviensis CBS 8886]
MTSTSTAPSSKGVYVPPHLRNRSNPSPSSTSPLSRNSNNPPATPPSSSRPYSSAPNRSSDHTSRSPWSHTSSPSSSHPGRNPYNNTASPNAKGYNGNSGNYGNAFTSGQSQSSSLSSNGSGYSSSPSLYVYGDSFVGPFKLLREDSVRVQTFKGSSAKGLNNPNSIKQVSKELLPIINGLLAPPPYAYMPSQGRWVMLIFGNVDLQINYLWQLANKPISHLSFTSTANSLRSKSHSHQNDIVDSDEDEIDEGSTHNDSRSRRPSNVLATATETSAKGPALGPELFVESVVKAYTSWLEREIVNGPVGKRIKERLSEQNQESSSGQSGIRRRTPVSKVLIAATLPPLVEDELLPRIPEKYVERLEEDHSKAQRAMERRNNNSSEEKEREKENGSRTPWAKNQNHSTRLSLSPTPRTGKLPDEDLEVGVSTLSLSDNTSDGLNPNSPKSTSSSSSLTSSHVSTLFESQRTANSMDTMYSSVHSLSPLPLPTSQNKPDAEVNTKTPVLELLAHDPPLCTLPVRVGMTNRFNTLIKQFCDDHSDILSFVDISPAMTEGSEQPSIHGEVDRNVWACPVDPTNVHPLWEPTLPLWKDELKKVGLPVDSWRISEDAQETFKAYEIDKRRRTEKRGDQRDVDVGVARIKLRDE